MKRIAIIGCGNLGKSIISGLLENNYDPSKIIATRRNLDSIRYLEEKGVKIQSDNLDAVSNSEIIVLAVKPFNILPVVEEVKKSLNSNHIIVSLATGVEVNTIKNALPEAIPVFRAMPNITADIGKSITCICHDGESTSDLKEVEQLFEFIGKNVIIEESLMEAATILGACGTAFVMRFIRAMIQGGIQIGFDANTAQTIVNHTVEGAAKHLILRNDHPEQAIDKVTTPKGCTIVGLNEMEHEGFSSSLIKGIVASYQKIAKE